MAITEPATASGEAMAATVLTADLPALPMTDTTPESIPAPPFASSRRVSATRDLAMPSLSKDDPSSDLQVPETVSIEVLNRGDQSDSTWQDRLHLSITGAGLALGDWQSTTTMGLLRPLLEVPNTWGQIMGHLAGQGISHEDLIPTLAVAEARGWITLSNPHAGESLDLAAFLRDTGLLSVDQVAALIHDSQAFRECRFEGFCKELVGKKMLSLAKAGFLNRLGRLASWHVVPAPVLSTADAG